VAVVVGLPDERLAERAVAYVTIKPGANLRFDELKQFLEVERMARQ
jgi:cyclohexanecarboxylate-CoA ligase